jgi:uncharacterized protein YcbX
VAVVGRVASLHRWPVKSMAGEPVDALWVGPRGAAGDRAHALLGGRGRGPARRLTAAVVPRLLAWTATYEVPGAELEPDAVPEPIVLAPDGRCYRWGDAELPDALEADVGCSVTRSRGAHVDRRDTLHVTVEATRRAAEEAVGQPLDLRRFRSNLHLELELEPFAEERWAGRILRVGEAELRLLEPCERCVVPTRDPETAKRLPELLRWLAREHATWFGTIARAGGPARVRVGEPVEIVEGVRGVDREHQAR